MTTAAATVARSPFSGKDLAGYSVSRAIANAEGGAFFKKGSLEREVHEELAKIREPSNGGFFVPVEIVRAALEYGRRSPYLVGTAAQGGNLVQTYFGAGIIQFLRNRSAAVTMGAMVIDGLVGNVAIPQWAGTVTASWVAESGAAADTEGTVNQVASSPRMLTARSTISRLLLMQSTPGIDSLVFTDLTRGLGVALDFAAFNGTGASNQPTGILNAAGLTSTSGATLTYATVVAQQVAVLAANGATNPETTGYVVPSAVAGLLAQRQAGVLNWPIWDNGTSILEGTLDGFRAISSEQIPAATMLFGDFSNLMILEWGPGLELAVNPYQNFGTGDVGIRGFLAADIVPRHVPSFAKIVSIT